MYGVWILQKDKTAYISLMNSVCGQPHIRQETEDQLQVDFCGEGMQIWVQTGYWYTF
jgi:hypothetical protein